MGIFGKSKLAASALTQPQAEVSADGITAGFVETREFLSDFNPAEVLALLIALDDLARMRALQSIDHDAATALDAVDPTARYAATLLATMSHLYQVGGVGASTARSFLLRSVDDTLRSGVRSGSDLHIELNRVRDKVAFAEQTDCSLDCAALLAGSLSAAAITSRAALSNMNVVATLVEEWDAHVDDAESGLRPGYWTSKKAISWLGGDPAAGGGIAALAVGGLITTLSVQHTTFLRSMLEKVRITTG